MKRECKFHLVTVESAPPERTDMEGLSSAYSPAMDIFETRECVSIVIETPGMAIDDIKIHWAKDKLIIRGSKQFNRKGENVRYYLLERPYGYFEKTFELPPHSDTGNITARLSNGVLNVTVPYLAGKAKPARI